MRLAMMQSTLHAYNVSSQLFSSVKDTFVESPKARKVTQVSMVNLFWLNGMKSKALHELNHPHYFAPQDQQYKSFFMPDTS